MGYSGQTSAPSDECEYRCRKVANLNFLYLNRFSLQILIYAVNLIIKGSEIDLILFN